MKNVIVVLLFLLSINCTSQTEKKFNLDFEEYSVNDKLPRGWFKWGNYDLEIDTVHVKQGKASGKISSKNAHNSFGSIVYSIPANYEGKSIRLDGFMKIENIQNGFSGLLLRIVDKNNEVLAFENMQSQNIHGTKDWQKYSISLPYPKNAETIFVAGIMTGSGEAWFDDFVLTIDGKDIQTLKEIEKPIYKANLDKEFDLGSKVDFPELNNRLIGNLDLLGKVWGFLKYHHPEIRKGNYNWDYELFRFLPEYLESKTTEERDDILLEWIKQIGDIDKCFKCESVTEGAFIKPDMSWFDNFNLSLKLKNELKYIYQNRGQGESFYVGYNNYNRLVFLNENRYIMMPYPDKGYRLLALYRYWNMIHYFFPYKYLIDKNWNDILREYIPKIINAKNELEYELTFIQLMGDINDTHVSYSFGFNKVNDKKGEFFPSFQVKFIDNKLVVVDHYNPELKNAAKVESGDIITSINKKSVESILDSIKPYYPASNEVARLRDISQDILRSPKNEITIEFISGDKKEEHSIPLYKKDSLNINWHNWKGKSFKFLKNNIGYVTLEFIKKEDIPIIKETFKNTKGIIIDIRNYPSAFVPFLLGTYFVTDNTPFVKFSVGNINNPGEFIFENGDEIPKPTETYKGKLVVLVNEFSQSQSEYTAMAFRAGNNTTIIGSTTAGADGNVITILLPGGLRTRMSGIGVYYPDGTETQRVGIVPDIEISPTIKGIKEGRDELLEKAIEIINK
ncbi:peptidase S41 [Tamlana nanhaiensis]|uniref:Peptidase S41 n=1 Tax=Neotamlana nanhaiensis TaxID=1382798 RepID=A0A0D7W626_9FLAO|nr:S41 family peptidase [Tamlana nanhaiensis]KJD34158.1 peptidase S41 [Tamlana nanhaiensis]